MANQVVTTNVEALKESKVREKYNTLHKCKCCCRLKGIFAVCILVNEGNSLSHYFVLFPRRVKLIGGNTEGLINQVVKNSMDSQFNKRECCRHSLYLGTWEHLLNFT